MNILQKLFTLNFWKNIYKEKKNIPIKIKGEVTSQDTSPYKVEVKEVNIKKIEIKN
jgi:hypothetical protein